MSRFPENWPDLAWAKLTVEQRERAVEIIRRLTNFEEVAAKVRPAHAEHGHDFIHNPPFAEVIDLGDGQQAVWSWHMSGGMGLRNYLRHEGFHDDELPWMEEMYGPYPGEGDPVGNWDDFYVQALEAACGVRPIEDVFDTGTHDRYVEPLPSPSLWQRLRRRLPWS